MKYKLIKEYPGSPKLDTICKYDKNPWSDSNAFTNPVLNPKHYPEFWEQVVEKDYEILSFINVNNKIYELRLDGRYFNDELKYNDYKYCLEVLKIHSVKRLSDSQIFTIGDIVKCEDCKGKITTLEIYGNDIYLNGIDNKMPFGFTLCNALDCFEIPQKVKLKLFTTEDGVDIFEGDSYYAVNTTFFNNYGSQKAFDKKSPDLTPFWQSNRSVCKYFSTKEKAEEYILMNKPCLSLKDVASIYISADKPITDTTSFSAQNRRIQNLVKSKIQQSV